MSKISLSTWDLEVDKVVRVGADGPLDKTNGNIDRAWRKSLKDSFIHVEHRATALEAETALSDVKILTPLSGAAAIKKLAQDADFETGDVDANGPWGATKLQLKVAMRRLMTLIQNSGTGAGSIPVADITARDLLTDLKDGQLVFVRDASADASVDAGSALYSWNAVLNNWDKVSELESMDISPSSSVAWGGITGSLENQTDLKTALDGKEPAIGAKGTAFNKSFGNTAGTAVEGNDLRLSNARPINSDSAASGTFPRANGTGGVEWVSVSSGASLPVPTDQELPSGNTITIAFPTTAGRTPVELVRIIIFPSSWASSTLILATSGMISGDRLLFRIYNNSSSAISFVFSTNATPPFQIPKGNGSSMSTASGFGLELNVYHDGVTRAVNGQQFETI